MKRTFAKMASWISLILALCLFLNYWKVNEFGKIKNGMTTGEVIALVGKPDSYSIISMKDGLLENYYHVPDSLLDKLIGKKHLYKVAYKVSGSNGLVVNLDRDGE